ncbi:hypothetical protein SLA_6606 [Streptomyces laurentii]|uniref:DUF6777 domain-containing protein n=1 Tax=Streptomyces laurentii TaxID=39478 RepID=A0A169PE88_STRLU|nr:hypothetical protein SLA_6606 [Streptomyces laurentii]
MRDVSRRRPSRPGTPPPGTRPRTPDGPPLDILPGTSLSGRALTAAGGPADARAGGPAGDAPGPRAGLRPGIWAVAALAPALLIAGCSLDTPAEPGAQPTPATVREVLLEPAGVQGPAPFGPSTVQEGAPAASDGAPAAGPEGAAPGGATGAAPAGRALTGATPGLYGGTRSTASCNVEQQVALLTTDPARARAFAEAAGIPEARLADWLRGLTPVLLRADARVTSHGLRDGRAAPFQSVLQTGTAVLVDEYATPRVRCAGGNPLRAPAPAPGARHKGRPWPGYRPDRVVAITPTNSVVRSLVLADSAGNTWFERPAGSDGEADRSPDTTPSCDPATCDLVAAPPAPLSETAGSPAFSGDPAGPPGGTGSGGSSVPGPPPGPGSGVPMPDGPGAPAGSGQPGVPDGPDAPAPADGGVPGGMDSPDVRLAPEGPGLPDGPGFPDGPGLPDGPGAPNGPDGPDGPIAPDSPPAAPDAPPAPDAVSPDGRSFDGAAPGQPGTEPGRGPETA